jgi:DNA ligase (NAD+)
MGSQEKAADPDEFLAWCAKVNHPLYIVEHKMDGASLELQYEGGQLARAITRGDGSVGDDITANARKMGGIPLRLPGGWSGAVRAEVLMSKDTLRTHFSDKANCRNAANGLMKRRDGLGVERLDLLCYDAAPSGLYDGEPGSLFAHEPEPPFNDELSKLEWLSAAGFSVVKFVSCATPYEVIDYRARVMAERDSYPFDIDGLVVKGRVVDPDDMRRARPEKQIAFKFALEEALTTLVDVEWSESGATYTPIAIVEPVRLAGTTVKRANLANTNTINGMGLKLGSRVMVVKRGEIIPKIEGLVDNPPGAREILVPTSCSCGAALVDEGTRLLCPNPACPKKTLHRIEKWLSVLDVRDFGGVIVGKLCASGRVKGIADLYTLTVDELVSFDRMGQILAAKILQNLRARSEISLAEFIAGFDIEGIGMGLAEKAVAAGYDSLDKLRAADAATLANVDGFGDINAGILVAGLSALTADMDAALASGALRIRAAAAQDGPFAGLSFCFTGELVAMKRSRAEALVKSLGGQARATVAKDLSYLVTNDPASGSSKNKSAVKYGVPIISEADFIAMAEKGRA